LFFIFIFCVCLFLSFFCSYLLHSFKSLARDYSRRFYFAIGKFELYIKTICHLAYSNELTVERSRTTTHRHRNSAV
jgi:hypothetical protein